MRPLTSYTRARWGYVLVLLLLSATIVVMAVYSYRAIDRELTESALSRRASVSYLAAVVLAEKFDRLVDIGVSLASGVRFRELIEAGNWAEAARIHGSVPDNFPFIDRFTMHDPRGTLMADFPVAPDLRGRNFAHRDWYQGVMRNGQPYVSEVYRRAASPQMNVFVAAVPIKSAAGKLLGILVVQVRTDTFFEWIKGVEVGAGGMIYVVDRRGMLAAHPKYRRQDELIDYSSVPAVQQVLRGNKGVEIEFNPLEGEKRVVAYEPSKHGWSVVLAQPAATVFATRDRQLKWVLSAYALVLIFMGYVTYLVSRIVIQGRQAQQEHRLNAELERRVAEQTAQLRESEERNRAIVDTAADAIIVIDERGAMQRFNPGAERMFGYSEAEVIGKNVAMLMPSPYREQHDGYLARYLATGEKRIIGIGREVVARRKNGDEFPADLAVAEMRLGERRMFTGIIRDITEAKRAAGQKEHLMTSLAATNKEMQSFSYSVSHDLRAPLRSMDGFSQVLLEDYGDKLDEEGKDALERIRAASQRMGQLIDDLLRLSQVTRAGLNVTRVDLSAIAHEIADALDQEQSGRTTEWVIETPLSIRADPALMRIALQNLLQNAWKFTGREERPVIRVGMLERDAKTVYFIADNGVGFDMAHAGSLFGAFQRLHHVGDFPGTGIGLAIVQRIIHRHGGDIWAESKEGAGATFFFRMEDSENGSDKQDHPAG